MIEKISIHPSALSSPQPVKILTTNCNTRFDPRVSRIWLDENGNCGPCPAKCQECESLNICATCSPGLLFNGGQCDQTCNSKC